VGGTLDYTIGSVGHEQTLQVAHANNDVVQVKLKTLAIERANTIAIFDASSNGFTGHYQEKERTTVFQLYLNTDTIFEGTPFVEGPNAIVIPTSLFTKTELHGYIEHDRLDETPLYSDEEGKYEFYSVDRDGNKLEDACGDCDFHIVRFDISAEEAMEILDLLLNCLIDEETNETAVLYSYISTKDDGISATMMNLPSAAMLFIPLDSPYVSAELGATPRPFDPLAWWLGILIVILCIITFGIAYLIITIVSSIADITTQNNGNAQSIGMTILSWLAHLAWLLVRAAVLIFIYILFAITLICLNIALIAMAAIVLTMSLFIQTEINLTLTDLQVDGVFSFYFGYKIGILYNEFFDIYTPTLQAEFLSDDINFGMNFSYFFITFELFSFPEDFLSDIIHNENTQVPGSGPKTSTTDILLDNEMLYLLEIISNIGDGLGHGAFSIGFTALIANIGTQDATPLTVTLLGIGIFVFEVVAWIYTTYIKETDWAMKMAALFGYSIGLMIAGIVAIGGYTALMCLTTQITLGVSAEWLEHMLICLDYVFTIIGILFALEELKPQNEETFNENNFYVIDAITSFTGGLIGLTVAGFAMICVPSTKKTAFTMLGSLFFFTGFFLALFAFSLFCNATMGT